MSKSTPVGIFWSLFKIVVAIFAILLIIIGIVVAPSPVPFGIVFIVLGFFLLSAVAPDLIRWLRRRWRWFDRQLTKLEKRLPAWIARQLRRSKVPEEDDGEKEH